MTAKLDLGLPGRKPESKDRPLRASSFINIAILLTVVAHVAASLSLNSGKKENRGEIKGWIESKENGFIPGIGNSDEAMKAIFSTDAGRICEKDVKTEKGIHIIKVREREKECQQSFDEVKDEVFRALRSRKQAEVQEGLLNELKEKYNVVIHQSAFSENASGGPVSQKQGKK
jgi:hypothetical protein